MNGDGPYVCSQFSIFRAWGKKSKAWVCMSIQLQCSSILLLFYSLLFWILILLKFNCLYVAGVQKRPIYTLPAVHMARTNRLSSVRSARRTILGCDELTVWRVDWHSAGDVTMRVEAQSTHVTTWLLLNRDVTIWPYFVAAVLFVLALVTWYEWILNFF